MQFLIFVDKVHYRSQPCGTDNQVSCMILYLWLELDICCWESEPLMPVTLHIKPAEYGRGLRFNDSTFSSDNAVVESCSQCSTQIPQRLANEVAKEVNEKPHCHYLSKNYSRNCCYHNALYMSATALKR